MLELSCCDYTFPLLDRGQALTLIHLLGFNLVDLGLFERSPNFRPTQLAASPRPLMEAMRNDLANAGLRAADVFLQVGTDPAQSSINDPDRQVRQAARDAFLLALELCGRIVCVHLTGLPGVPHGDPSADIRRAAEETAWRLETAAAAGITYSIEPHVGSICPDTYATHALLAQVPGLTLTLDYGHFFFQGEGNEEIHSLLPWASHLHLRGAARGRLQTSVAESAIDLQHIVQSLLAGFRGSAAIEYVWSDWHECNRTDNLSETILLRRQIRQKETNLSLGEHQHV